MQLYQDLGYSTIFHYYLFIHFIIHVPFNTFLSYALEIVSALPKFHRVDQTCLGRYGPILPFLQPY